ncbi:MAG TPA: HD domain-containing protein [Phototrophicaceae bacterium]|nr:HD domain-containing protein [Phototrophicaceae bacterium]
MNDLTPRAPERPLIWPDFILDLCDWLRETPVEVVLVGGAVRDALLHRPLKDVDLATAGDGIRLARHIANHFDGDFFVLDAERDVGRALVATPEGRLTLDVSRFRGGGLGDDLADRDFTVNAMAVDARGDLSRLIDPLNGETDAAHKRLRRCREGAVINDPIRVLRAVRQSVQLGFRLEPETLAEIKTAVPLLVAASPERVRDEVFKLLALSRPVRALRIADHIGVLAVVLPEVRALQGMPQSHPHVFDGWQHTLLVVDNLTNILTVLDYGRSDNLTASFSLGTMAAHLDHFRPQLRAHIAHDWPNERPHRALLLLAALLHDVGKPATAQLDETDRWRFFSHEILGAELAEARTVALRLSNDERERLVAIVRNHMRPLLLDELTPRAIHRFWRALGAAGIDVCLLSLADYLGARGPELDQDEWLKMVDRVRILLQAYFEQHDQLVAPPALVDGHVLLQTFALKPGPIIGQLLEHIREGQVAGEINTTEDALQAAGTYLNQNGKG